MHKDKEGYIVGINKDVIEVYFKDTNNITAFIIKHPQYYKSRVKMGKKIKFDYTKDRVIYKLDVIG